jgi:AAA+ ATPase superfamily predicted ATPase
MENIEWKHPETITGPPAEGVRFFRRNYINEELWREILKGVHILFAAPRRVGKTSIMKDIVNQGKKGYLCIFENIQSVNTNEKFYQRLYFLILNQLGNFSKTK